MSIRSQVGLVLTVFWVIGGALYLYFAIGWPQVKEISPNELGDFLSGFAAPLAFFWLVIGYFQQGEELRLQREELELQRHEVARLADDTERQAAAVEANEKHTRRDTFIHYCEFVSQEQKIIALRILQIVIGMQQTRDFLKYSGESSEFFIFYAAVSNIFPARIDKFEDRLATSIEFNSLIRSYRMNFDNLMEESSRFDESNSMRRQIEGSAMGTLYAGICWITGQTNLFRIRKAPLSIDEIC